MKNSLRVALVLVSVSSTAGAQDGTIVYRLGRDTAAIETFTRSASRLTGEIVVRTGPAVARTEYEIGFANGRVASATVRRKQADGSAPTAGPLEYRFTYTSDSTVRETVFKDSTARRSVAGRAFPILPVYAYGSLELLNAIPSVANDSIAALSLGGGNAGWIGLERVGGDTLRLRGTVPYQMMVRFDRAGRLQSVDGTLTTNKAIGTRGTARVDIAAIAAAMKPTGTLSPRQTAYVSILQGPITVNYGSPAVRGRSVWGGTLVPFDSIWRTGANEATHLATAKTLQFGELTLAPGLYTLWTQHTRSGTWLIVNRQVGQWGTQYNAANDVGRVPMTLADTPSFAEDFTIAIRSLGQGRGALDIAWGDKVATANFTAR
jgi:hypothetical protein